MLNAMQDDESCLSLSMLACHEGQAMVCVTAVVRAAAQWCSCSLAFLAAEALPCTQHPALSWRILHSLVAQAADQERPVPMLRPALTLR